MRMLCYFYDKFNKIKEEQALSLKNKWSIMGIYFGKHGSIEIDIQRIEEKNHER